MDNASLQQQESDTQQKRSFFAGKMILSNLLSLIRRAENLLAGLFLLSEEERQEAGVYLGRQRKE